MLATLLQRRICFIGLEARGLRCNEEHRQADILCEKAGTFAIENLAQTERLPKVQAFTIYTACFDAGETGLPCKVIAELDLNGHLWRDSPPSMSDKRLHQIPGDKAVIWQIAKTTKPPCP